jgi:hypothetical protein
MIEFDRASLQVFSIFKRHLRMAAGYLFSLGAGHGYKKRFQDKIKGDDEVL